LVVTVPKDTEGEILRLHYAEHWPVGTIAAQLEVHADVVRRVLGHAGAADEAGKVFRRSSMLEPYGEFIEQTLREYPTLRATRLYDMLRERGFTGSPRTVRKYVYKMRPRPKPEAFVRVETLPGEQAQVDWAHVGRMPVTGGERSLWVFVIVLGYSRALWAELVLDLTADSLCRSLVRAAAYFGGVTRQWLFDNAKSVVLERHGDAARFHPALLDLCAHMRVQPRLCGVRQPEHKGKVERAIRYLRERFFAGRRIVDIDEGNRELVRFLDEIAHQRQHPTLTERTVAEVLADERARLLGLPDPLPPAEHMRPIEVDKMASARFDTNIYSVPPQLAGRTLTLAVDDRIVRVLDGAQEVARHARCWGRRQTITDPSHRAALLAQRPAARDLRGRDRLRVVCSRVDELLARCVDNGRLVGAAVARLTQLLDLYGDQTFAFAVEDVLDAGSSDVSAVVVACERRRRERGQPVPLDVAMPAHIPDRDVIPHALEDYDEP
jgi:transposase